MIILSHVLIILMQTFMFQYSINLLNGRDQRSFTPLDKLSNVILHSYVFK